MQNEASTGPSMKCSVKISLNNNQQLKDFGSHVEIPNSKHLSQ